LEIISIYIFFKKIGECSPHPCPGLPSPDENDLCPFGCMIDGTSEVKDGNIQSLSALRMSLKYTLGISDMSFNITSLLENETNIYSFLTNTSFNVSIPFSNEKDSSEKVCVVEKCAVYANASCLYHTENRCIPTGDGCRYSFIKLFIFMNVVKNW
jgi:hypothetical protein